MPNEFEEKQTERARLAFSALCKLPQDEVGLKEYQRNVNKAIHEYLDADSIWRFAALCREDEKTLIAMRNAQKRHDKDPKQDDKVTIRTCWDAWQKNPGDYKNKAAFARDMLKQFEILQSQRVIERWCLKWEREQEPPAS
ncbi:MAG: hypothetical protein D4R79_12320 [Comamonadaceae bacterium]|nr:MAG: hypothetical protein D4R79_12320 [Comamonadaceae bacterium]